MHTPMMINYTHRILSKEKTNNQTESEEFYIFTQSIKKLILDAFNRVFFF